MHAVAMKLLAKRLTQQGFECHIFGYYSMLHRIAQHSERLHNWLSKNFASQPADGELMLVGHSLGGLVIRDFLHRYPKWVDTGKIKRIVTLGTPHAGSLSADTIVKILPAFIGKSYLGALDGQAPALDSQVQLGVIAGNKSAGLGRLVMKKDWRGLENDGTVFVHETHLANLTAHITLPCSHTGLIFDKSAAEQTTYFLTHGYFIQ